MRKPLQLLMATALALLIAAPATASSPSTQTVTLTGTLASVHEDALGSNGESDHYSLTVGAEQYEVRFAGRGPDGENGAEVTATGKLAGHTLVVGHEKNALRFRKHARVSMVTSSGTTSGSSTPGAAAQAVTGGGGAIATAKIAAVLINFTDLATKPFTSSAVASALYGVTGSAKAFFEEESKGRMTVSGAVFGWYTIASTTAGCHWTDWVTLGANAANAAGANLAAYTNVVYIFPNTTQCSFAGLGYVPGNVSLLNGTLSVQVMTHELGHNFGLGHANGAECAVNGVRVALSTTANCTESGYVDPFSTMGNNALRHNAGSQLGELGWLSDSEKVVGTPGTTYTISPYFSSGGVKLVRIPRGDGSYLDLDFRSTYGSFDNFAAGSPPVSGVTIRLGRGTASPTSSPQATDLIDTTPSTASWADAPLLLNKTFTDPVSTISFTTTSVSTLAVQVRVREGIAPSAPGALSAAPAADGSSVALAWGAATDNVAVGNYRIARNGAVVATVGADELAWTDAAPTAGATYTYSVTALDTSGNAGPAATATAAIAAATPAPTPDPSAAPSADPSAGPSADPSAAPSPDPSAAPSQDPSPSDAPPSAAPTPDPNASAPPTSVGPADTLPPTIPEPLTGTAATTTITLAWGASADDHGVAAYTVTRNGTTVATVTGTGWTDTGRAPKTAYTYTVTAVDTSANRGPAASLAVTTTPDTRAPSMPGYFHKVRQSGRYVTFAWGRSSDNVRVVQYVVYRYGRSTPVARTTRLAIRLYTVRGAVYYVRAIDAAGNRSSISRKVGIRY